MSTAITKKEQLVEAQLANVAKVMVGKIPPEKLQAIVFHALRKVPKLAECDNVSFMNAVMTCARLGLMPDGLEAAIVPYGSEATFVPMYKGIMRKIRETGAVHAIEAHVVYEKDYFEYEQGMTPKLVHRPAIGDRGEKVAVYAIARPTNPSMPPQFDVMGRDEVLAIKARVRARQTPWNTSDEGEMWKKTAVKRLAKYLPLNDELMRALDADDALEAAREAEVVDDGAPKRPTDLEGLKQHLQQPEEDPFGEPEATPAEEPEEDPFAAQGEDWGPDPLDPADPSGFAHRMRFQAVPPPWEQWKDTKPWRGKLGEYTPAEVIEGSKNGGRHAILLSSVQYQASRTTDPEQVAQSAIYADYCLAFMEERFEREGAA